MYALEGMFSFPNLDCVNLKKNLWDDKDAPLCYLSRVESLEGSAVLRHPRLHTLPKDIFRQVGRKPPHDDLEAFIGRRRLGYFVFLLFLGFGLCSRRFGGHCGCHTMHEKRRVMTKSGSDGHIPELVQTRTSSMIPVSVAFSAVLKFVIIGSSRRTQILDGLSALSHEGVCGVKDYESKISYVRRRRTDFINQTRCRVILPLSYFMKILESRRNICLPPNDQAIAQDDCFRRMRSSPTSMVCGRHLLHVSLIIPVRPEQVQVAPFQTILTQEVVPLRPSRAPAALTLPLDASYNREARISVGGRTTASHL
jgi:hypothetical protein